MTTAIPTLPDLLRQPLRMLIDGQWTQAEGQRQFDVINPSTGELIAQEALGGAAEVDRAVQAARKAFEGGAWPRMRPAERSRLLLKLADAVEQAGDELALLETLNTGKPLKVARAFDVAHAAECLRYNAGWATKLNGETRQVSLPGDWHAYILREAIGVVGLIVPWNVPLSTAILKLIPALAAGCTVVLKPSEETPLSALALGQALLDAGLPAGVVNIVNGLGAEAGQALSEHPGVDKVSFTGSTATGRRIIAAAMGNLKKVSLELGGKSPVVVMPDADLALAVPGVAMATFFLQGQNCMAGTRIFAHESIHDALIEGVAAFANSMTLGHGLSPMTMQGPLISAGHTEKVMRYIEGAKASGATLVAGGERLDRAGNFVRPTIFTDCTPDMPVVREEIFGPVMAVQKFGGDDLDAIAALANDTPYGLSGSVWTRDLSTAHRLVKRIRAGHVSINCHGAVGTNVPFGGYGQSGWGREFGQEGLDAYLETKAVTVRL